MRQAIAAAEEAQRLAQLAETARIAAEEAALSDQTARFEAQMNE